MKKILGAVLLVLALGTASCVEDVVSVQITEALANVPDESCGVGDTSTQKGHGSLDLGYASQSAPAYWLGIRMVNALNSQAITAGGENVNPPSRNDFYLKEAVLNYEGKGLPSIAEAVSPIAGRVPAGGELVGGVNVLSADAFRRLDQVATDQGIEVTVNLKIRGTFASGQDFETAAFSFPLTVYKTMPPTCTEREEQVAAGSSKPPCGNWGQDGSAWTCSCKASCGGCAAGETCNASTCACEAAASE
jgi:hypothetical protein